ncbi:MAG TPA: hypothetical protein VE033_00125, partial [Acetobacteraceae bacterium]|nr:hypothetical protein [Acetobacteraceae bacterium]
AEAGASVPQIAAISGHAIEQKQKILGHYVLRSRQMALGAMDLLLGNAGQIRRGFVLLQGGTGEPAGNSLRTGTDERD